MELLKLNRKIMKTLGICSLADGSAFYLRIGQWMMALLQVSFFTMAFTTSFWYFLKHYHEGGFQRSILAVGQAFGDFQSCISFICLFIQAKKIREFYDLLQRAYDQCAKTEIVAFYLRANRICEQFAKWTLCITVGSFSVGVGFVAAAGVLFYFIRDGNVETKNLFLPWQLELPFDSNTVGGYSAALVGHVMIGIIYFSVLTAIESIFLSMGMYFGAFHSHYKLLLDNVNELVDRDTGASGFDLRMQLKRRLIEVIKLHIQAKELFGLCCGILRVTIFIQVVLAALLISSLQFEMASGTKPMDLQSVSALAGGLVSNGNIFLFCFIGSYATERLSRYAHTAYESHWYKFPVSLQPFVRLIIADAQRPLSFNGLGMFDLNLMLYARIMKASMSYILMFRNF